VCFSAAFRTELAAQGPLRPIDKAWDSQQWSTKLPNKWRTFGSVNGVTYGLSYNYGDRSGIFYNMNVLKRAGIASAPKSWDQFLASFSKLRAAGVTPIAMPAKVWAHAEWFESICCARPALQWPENSPSTRWPGPTRH
jgi:multiple sugar transport system substrate-binding protein